MSFQDEVSAEIASLDSVILELDSAITKAALAGDLDYRDVAEVVFRIHLIKNNIGMIYDVVTNLLDRSMADLPEVDLGGGFRIEKKVASDRRAWKHGDLAGEIARRLIKTNVDMETGEMQKSPEELMSEMLRFLQPSYWRVKELLTIGVNADNYCEVLEPKTSIIVRKPKEK
jgi:hypothetical protein